MVRPDLFDCRVEHLLPVVDHHDALAHLLGLEHHVRAEDDRAALLVLLDHELLEQTEVYGVETAIGLVQDQQLGLVQHGGDELDLLLHALGEFLAPLASGVRELDAIEPMRDALAELGISQALELAHVLEEVGDLHLAVHAAFFGQVADAVLAFQGAALAEHAEGSRVWEEDRHEHADRRALTGTVGADEPGEAARLDSQVQSLDGDLVAERLTQVFDDHRVFHRASLPE